MAWYDTLKDNITSIFTDPEKQMPLPATSLMTNAELIDAGGREGTGLNYGNLTQPAFPIDYSLLYEVILHLHLLIHLTLICNHIWMIHSRATILLVCLQIQQMIGLNKMLIT